MTDAQAADLIAYPIFHNNLIRIAAIRTEKMPASQMGTFVKARKYKKQIAEQIMTVIITEGNENR